jgi:hypothetical protein
VRLGWDRWLGEHSAFVGMHGFGASDPGEDAHKYFGITAEKRLWRRPARSCEPPRHLTRVRRGFNDPLLRRGWRVCAVNGRSSR